MTLDTSRLTEDEVKKITEHPNWYAKKICNKGVVTFKLSWVGWLKFTAIADKTPAARGKLARKIIENYIDDYAEKHVPNNPLPKINKELRENRRR